MFIRYSTIWLSSGALLVFAASIPNPQQAGKKGATAPPKKAVADKSGGSKTGEMLFLQQCAPCHGKKGEGTGAYARSLTGNQSVTQLAKYIAQEMPPGPKKCSSADAQKIAPYIYDAFYSPIAQERNRPARITLSRLTVRQVRNSVTDLLGSFRGQQPAIGAERGLKADYFKAKRFQEADRVVQRVDPQVAFNFGQKGPEGGEFQPHQFSIRWVGSVVAPDTGVYEFVIRTEHAGRLWLNDNKKPLIDGWVKSGNDNEYRGSIYLVGGRSYPLRMEFTKSTQGVDDTAKLKDKPIPPASFSLSWKQPKQSEEIVPSRCLIPASSPESFVMATPFPPDDRSMGYERGTSVSKAWDEATTSAALETADYVTSHLRELAGNSTEVVPIKAFCKKFVERALRRPLDPDTEQRYIEKQFANSPDTMTAVRRVVLLTLKSPRFLYREPDRNTADPYDIASRLSFTLWDSLPDSPLMQAAAAGNLKTREQIAAQAERMASDPRAWAKQRDFFLQWLKVDQYPDLVKDAKKYPDFTPTVAADLRASFDLTLENTIRSERSDFRELILSDKVYLNGRLAKLYNVPLAPDAPFQAVDMDPKQRAGILTHPYILSSFAYTATSSPIHRGVLLIRSVMGRTLQPPPAAFAPLAANLHPKLTTRQRVSLQTKPAACMSCHSMINPLGFTMERFDAIGRLRTVENGQPIDATGSYEPKAGGPPVKFNGAQDLARYVAESPEAHAAFVEKIFQYHVKQPIRAYGAQELPRLREDFAKNGFNVRRLVAEIATETALPPPAPALTQAR
jgi:mono/diheme cytochrome c family protein